MNLEASFQSNRVLSDFCTLGIGGPARYFAEVRTLNEMQLFMQICQEHDLPYLILGKGSNTLFDDRGFKGAVLLNKIDFIETKAPGVFRVGSGYSFSLLGVQTARQSWSGLEFASGIPGTVGGAVYMNAGANRRETCESLVEVEYLDQAGTLHLLKREALEFGHRFSTFQQLKGGAIIAATFCLTHDPLARENQLKILQYRKATQPYKAKSAGCIFRNPHNGQSGALIDQSGLKGRRQGGAQVSEVHANFLINENEAKGEDFLKLIDIVRHEVFAQKGTTLEPEICCIPYEIPTL